MPACRPADLKEEPRSDRETMQALLLDAPNTAFQIRELPKPVPEPGQVLVRIAASGVHPGGGAEKDYRLLPGA